MKYRVISKTKENLSVLGFGCMRFPTSNGKIDVNKSIEMLKYAISNGVNYLDTAYPYHFFQSEKFLGNYILNQDFAKDVFVATKMPVYMVKKSSDLTKIFNKQYKNLNRKTIDYYLLHAINKSSYLDMVDLNIHSFLERLRDDGKIRNIGFSFHGSVDDFKFIIDSYDWDFCQIQLNIVDEQFQAGIIGLDYAVSKGVSVIIMEPLRGGSLVNNLPKGVEEIYRKSNKRYNNVEWALHYLYNNEKVTSVLSGMSTIEQVKENVKIANESKVNVFGKEENEILDAVRKEYLNSVEINCTGCGYCVDCPAGIDIPYAFQTVNNYKLYKRKLDLGIYMKTVGINSTKPNWTSNCIDCGKCERHCPQNILIRKEFKKVSKTIETPFIKFVVKIARIIFKK